MQLADRYGLTGASAMARRKAGLPPMSSGGGGGDSDVNAAPSQAVSIDEVEGTDCIKDLFTTDIDLCRATSVDQRLNQADTQPTTMADVYPRHKHLVVKR